MSGPGTTHLVRSFGGGRVCVAGGCATILSSYNPSSWCAIHDRLSPARKRRGADRPTDSRTCANPACGTVFESVNARRQYCSDDLQRAGLPRAPTPQRRDGRSEVSPLNEGTHTYTRDQMLEAERWAWAGKLTAGRASTSTTASGSGCRSKGTERRAPVEAETPAEGWWHKPECNCGLCRAPSETTDAVEQGALAEVQASPEQVTDLRDWPGPQRTAMRLRRPRSPVALSLAEVRESGLPALLLDFGEALLYLDGEIFEVDASLAPLRAGLSSDPASRRDPRDRRRHRLRLAPRRPLRLPLLLEGRTTRRSGSIGRVVSVRETRGER